MCFFARADRFVIYLAGVGSLFVVGGCFCASKDFLLLCRMYCIYLRTKSEMRVLPINNRLSICLQYQEFTKSVRAIPTCIVEMIRYCIHLQNLVQTINYLKH